MWDETLMRHKHTLGYHIGKNKQPRHQSRLSMDVRGTGEREVNLVRYSNLRIYKLYVPVVNYKLCRRLLG